MALKQQDRSAGITTPLGADKLVLRSLQGHEELSRLFHFDLELLSEDPAIRFEDIIGKSVTLWLRASGDRKRYCNGFVSQFTQVAPLNRYPCYRAVVVPWLWFLTRSADCQIFQKKTVPQIIEEVFKKHSFDAYELKLTDSYEPREYCVQYRETAFDFVSRLMEEEGICYFFRHEEAKHILVLTDASSAHQPCERYAEIAFRPPDETSKSGEHVRDWMINKEILTGRYAHTDYNFEMPKTNLEARSEIIREHAQSDLEKFDYPGEYQEHKEGDRYARIRIQEIQSRYETLRGEGDARGMCVGYTFTLHDHPRPDQKREYLIVSATHRIESDFYDSAGGAALGDPVYRCSFTVIPASVQFRPACVTPKPIVQGPQTAIVVGPAGEEIHTDPHARVKVQFHWDRYGQADENSSCWVRVAQAWAGKKWGAIYTPRIGQEVIVEFLEGDPDQPIITGRVYNAEAIPPYDLPAQATMSTLKSLSSKGGQGFNEIRFEDKKGSEQVFIHAEKNLDLRVKADAYETVGQDRHVDVKRDQFEHIENNRHEKVDADKVAEIGKDLHVKVSGKEAKEVAGSKSLAVSGDVIEMFKANHFEQTANNLYIKGMGIVIESMQGLTLKVGGNSVVIDPAGVTVTGTMVTIDSSLVKIASGPGSPAASGNALSAVAPLAAALAAEADKAKPGEILKPPVSTAQPHNPSKAKQQKQKKSWIEIELVGEDGEPIPGEAYQIELPDGTVAEGSLDEKGLARVDGIEAGNCKITFPNLDQDAWEPA